MSIVLATDTITVKFSDWLFNAGILGFVKIITEGNINNCPADFKIGDNYISFKREHLKGFSEKYFDTAFKQYGRFDKNVKELQDFVTDINKMLEKIKLDDKNEFDEKKLKRISDRYKSITTATLLKNKLKENNISPPIYNDFKKDPKLFVPILENTLSVLKDNSIEFYEADVQIYLRWIYGQKSFLNNSVTKDRIEKFKKDFEEPVLSNSNKTEKKLICLCCTKRPAKKGVNFDTGISPFLGVNTDSINYLWNFDPRIPLCEFCELIYFCYFAGFTDVIKGKERKFYFVNSDSNFDTLSKDNFLFNSTAKDKLESAETTITRFITRLVIDTESKKGDVMYNNKSLIELDLTNETFPKIYSLNVTREKSEFIKDNQEKLEKLSKAGYSIKDSSGNIAIEFMDQILKSKVSYSYVNKLTKYYIASLGEKSDYYKCYFNFYHLQELNLLTGKYIEQFYRGDEKMSEKSETKISQGELWAVYKSGLTLKTILNKDNDKKVKGLAHKLLNCLRIGEADQFLNIMMRMYMAASSENQVPIPGIFVKSINNKEAFYSIGYSFVNGLLGQEYDKDSKKEGVENV